MTLQANFAFPAPTDPEEFEEKVQDALRVRHLNIHLARLGRSGQAQSGLDGMDFVAPPEQRIVWQTTLQVRRALPKLKSDLNKMDEAGLRPLLFIYALGDNRDARIQNAVASVSADRQQRGLCPIEALFWNDIRQIILDNQPLRRKWYPQFFPETPTNQHNEGTSQQDKAIHDYVTWVGELISRGFNGSSPGDPLQAQAIARTHMLFCKLGPGHKAEIITYLARSGLINAPTPIISLKRADLRQANLANTDFRPIRRTSERSGISLHAANLENACLRNTHLAYADLWGATLVAADLRGSRLCCAILRKANLRGARLDGANLGGADLRRADLRNASLAGANLGSAKLADVVLDGAVVREADFRDSKGLTQPQLDATIGGVSVKLPSGLFRPTAWTTVSKHR